jgi:hypothetical protein
VGLQQQSLHCGPTALRYRPICFASRGRTAAPPCVSRQSRDARRRVDHHGPRAPYAGGQSSRSPGATGRTDRPRPSRPQNPPPQPAYVRLQGPSAHGKVATLLLQETARPDERRLSWLIRSCNAFSDGVWKAGADVGSGCRQSGRYSAKRTSTSRAFLVKVGGPAEHRSWEADYTGSTSHMAVYTGQRPRRRRSARSGGCKSASRVFFGNLIAISPSSELYSKAPQEPRHFCFTSNLRSSHRKRDGNYRTPLPRPVLERPSPDFFG